MLRAFVISPSIQRVKLGGDAAIEGNLTTRKRAASPGMQHVNILRFSRSHFRSVLAGCAAAMPISLPRGELERDRFEKIDTTFPVRLHVCRLPVGWKRFRAFLIYFAN